MALLLAGCAMDAPGASPTALAIAQPSATATPSPSPTPLPSATVTPTPPPTATAAPTPLPTAVSLTVSGNPRATQLREPEPDGRYPCGMVDVFDFPIDPPDAAGVQRGGEDFGVYRSRYGKYHAGEDWGGTGGSSALGTPVHSIGHGLVTYAEPLGWGRDQGVVIVEHTFEDGSRLLSFYGHLDPDSVVLRPGVCVVRGEQVGKIGRPRTVPHLHFEIRTQQPYAPLGGYWDIDPTQAGYLWPSQAVWNQRIVTAPGVSWTRPYATTDLRSPSTGPQLAGQLDATTLLLVEAGQLLAVNLADGRTLERLLDDGDREEQFVAAATVDARNGLIYVAERPRGLAAYRPAADSGALEQVWRMEPSEAGVPQLLPLPDGGVALAYRGDMQAVSPEGSLLWTQPLPARPFDWLMTPAGLVWSQTGAEAAVWLAQGSAPPRKLAAVGGHLAVTDAALWVLAPDGVYRIGLQDEEPAAVAVLPLANTLLHRGDIVGLPDGGVLVAAADATSSRLLVVTPDGAVAWQGAVPDAVEGELWLVSQDGETYLLAQRSGGAALDLAIYGVDLDTAVLHRLLVGGSRYPLPTETWLQPLAMGSLLLNIGGGQLVAFDPASATGVLAGLESGAVEE